MIVRQLFSLPPPLLLLLLLPFICLFNQEILDRRRELRLFARFVGCGYGDSMFTQNDSLIHFKLKFMIQFSHACMLV
jgi:hypothetical protein